MTAKKTYVIDGNGCGWYPSQAGLECWRAEDLYGDEFTHLVDASECVLRVQGYSEALRIASYLFCGFGLPGPTAEGDGYRVRYDVLDGDRVCHRFELVEVL